MENKTGKYLKYAIGEIVLVVIGILIALQINNWNEKNKESKLEQSYYCLLLDEVEQDKQQVMTLIILTKERIESSNNAISFIQKEKVDLEKLGIAISLSRRNGSATFLPNTSTYEDIKSSGNINILKDKKITKSLNRYIKTVEGYRGTILSNFDIVINRVTQNANWFNTGVIHANYKDIYPKEIQDKLRADLPNQIPPEFKTILYQDLIVSGNLLKRRLELLNLIETEVDKMKSELTNRCELND